MKLVLVAVTALITVGIFFLGFHLGQKSVNVNTPTSVSAVTLPESHSRQNIVPSEPVQTKLNTSRLDGMVENYNADMHSFDQLWQSYKEMNKESQDHVGDAVGTAIVTNETKILEEQEPLRNKLVAENKAIHKDSNFDANYRETLYIGGHEESDQAWANLRYIEHK